MGSGIVLSVLYKEVSGSMVTVKVTSRIYYLVLRSIRNIIIIIILERTLTEGKEYVGVILLS